MLLQPRSPEVAEPDDLRIGKPVTSQEDEAADFTFWIAGYVIAQIIGCCKVLLTHLSLPKSAPRELRQVNGFSLFGFWIRPRVSRHFSTNDKSLNVRKFHHDFVSFALTSTMNSALIDLPPL